MDRHAPVAERPQHGHRRNKSSTSVLKSIITSKSLSKSSTKGKENTTPPQTANPAAPAPHTPIWAEFASSRTHQHGPSPASTTKIPLNDRLIDREINLYTPNDYSPSKQRNFHDIQRPTLFRKDRPTFQYLPKSKSTTSVFETFTRANSDFSRSFTKKFTDTTSQGQDKRTKTSKVPLKGDGGAERVAKATRSASRDLLTMARKGSKVMGLVAAFNSKTDSAESELDAKQIDAQFEAVLESRNIPQNMRQNLRSLKTSVKVNLIRGNELDLTALGAGTKSAPSSTKTKGSNTQSHRRGLSETTDLNYETDDGKKSGKRGRARSKTFTFNKSGSPSKKQKGVVSEAAVYLHKSTSAISLVGGKRGASAGEGTKSSIPEDFVSYLRSEQQPEKVEVGKVHRLRQILRNETVSWVETFIKLGGMTEIVGLLHRIMQVEWREEHEDQLLHEALLCLKALCTTDIALQKLCEIEKTLFPALLGMIFDPEHKGPSEYTTRGVIMSILLTHLKSGLKDSQTRTMRAVDILGYLSDPLPPEEKRPMPFILDMRQSRPYKIWHREVSNVTKEVFWIFLHHHNVVALPQESDGSTSPPTSRSIAQLELNLSAEDYNEAYFPQPRPPVPAAPYVGGVEWEATNYIAAHLDLMNGLIATLSTKQERNALRLEIRNSGWEKVMGSTLRTCKEKFYDCVHCGLRTWVAAAAADGWDTREVRMGPKLDSTKSPQKTPAKKLDKPPVIDAPKLDLDLGLDDTKKSEAVKGWI